MLTHACPAPGAHCLPPGELQYQGRHVPALLARNSALQKEVGGKAL